MSFLKRLQKIALIGSLGGTLLMPEAQAQDTAPESIPASRIMQTVKEGWTWGNDAAAIGDRMAYDSLPAEYKAFANKSFMERLEMKEEWEQRDFIKRDRKRSAILKKNPDATIKDFFGESQDGQLKLADYPCAEGSYERKIMQEMISGKLTPRQAKVAEELYKLGRPVETVDPKLPYADQLRSCGLDVAANVAEGTKITSLDSRDLAIYIAQDRNAETLHDRNADEYRELCIRFEKEKAEEWEKNHGFWSSLFQTKTRLLSEEETKGMFPRETINGKDVSIRQPNEISYSILDEVTRKVATKIDQEERINAERAKAARIDR